MYPWLILLIIVLVVFIVWWALWRNAKTYKPDFEVHGHAEEQLDHNEEVAHEAPIEETQTTHESPAIEVQSETETVRAAEAVVAAAVQPDDLTVIEGIGPKVDQLLQAAGIQTYAQLAEASTESLKAILEPAGLRMMDPSSWSEQARLLSRGDMEAFQELVKRLRGGRKVD
jgi:large subunit ribosomal protein L17